MMNRVFHNRLERQFYHMHIKKRFIQFIFHLYGIIKPHSLDLQITFQKIQFFPDSNILFSFTQRDPVKI